MDKLLIADGSNLLFQMFYGMPARIMGADGRPIAGTLGFVGALLKIIRMTEPTHVAVVFDGEHENMRTQLDGDYKGNRPDYSAVPEEETPFSQLPDIYAALDALGIRHRETETCEADDWIAGYAHQYGGSMDIVIASQDSDFFQLICENVQVLRYRGKKSVLCDTAYIRERFGIEPGQYADFKCLVGDPADNIRGVPGIGPKTAAQLLGQFQTLDGILAHLPSVQRPSVRASLTESAARLHINRRLIRLDGAHPLPFPQDALRWPGTSLTTTEVLRAIHVL